MEEKTEHQSGALSLICPTCGARYTLPKYVEGQRYGCKRCSASLMFGKFALQQELGRGGFGVVYKAFQADLQRVVALKFLHTDSEESTERFMREARIAANLSHPNITAIYEVGQHEGKPYIAMQFVDGITANKADFSIRESVFVVRDAAIAVDYAHAREVIHRDIKPHNIMVTQERSGTSVADTLRRTFVMDFGLARSANRGGTLTTEGQVMGTPAFMSPEQAEGKSCDARSDVYSLGATLYCLAANRPPFEAPTPLQILMAVTQEEPDPPSKHNPEIDRGLEAIILKAMAKDPAQRYPTASRLAQDLTSWLAGGVTDAGPTVQISFPPTDRKVVAGAKKGRWAMIAVGTILMITGAAGLAWQFLPRSAGTSGAKDPKETGTAAHLPAPTPLPPPQPTVPAASIVLLEVLTDPAEALVRVGNREMGKSPLSLNDSQLVPGTYDVVIMKPGFKIKKDKVTVTPGPKTLTLDYKLEPEERKIAFVVESIPSGARILLNGTDTGATTPHAFHVDEVGGTVAQVELELEGYVTARRSFDPTGDTKRVPLSAKTGSFFLTGTVSGATVSLFPIPPGLKNVSAALGLWSENPDSLAQAASQLNPEDAPFVVQRLRELAARPDLGIRERLAKFLSATPSLHPLAPERSVAADGGGGARLENAWVLNRYRIFVTSPRTLDFVSAELEPRVRDEISITAETTVIVSISAKEVRPRLGKFTVEHSASNPVGPLLPGGAPVRVAAGPVYLKYVPPEKDPLLCSFTVPLTLKESYELAGSLYQYCAEAYTQEQNIPMAVQAYTKLLDEPQFPTSEQNHRTKLPELVRKLYREWIEAGQKQGKTLGGDLEGTLDQAKKKPYAEALPALLDLYEAKDATPAVRANAASALAFVLAKTNRPYEAMEWCERAVKEKVDPGQETALAVVAALKGYPGLPQRWEIVSAAIEELRKAAPAKPEPAPTPAPAADVKVGILNVTKFGIFVRLEPNVELAKGDILQVFHDGGLVGEITVEKRHGPEGAYPNGSAECRRSQGAIQKGDEVRLKK